MPRHLSELWLWLCAWARGRANAVKTAEVARHFGVRPSMIRAWTHELTVTYHKPIASSIDPRTGGLFVPETQEEIDDYVANLEARAVEIFERRRAFMKATGRPEIEQHDLPFDRLTVVSEAELQD